VWFSELLSDKHIVIKEDLGLSEVKLYIADVSDDPAVTIF
jgi:hypothetical protein